MSSARCRLVELLSDFAEFFKGKKTELRNETYRLAERFGVPQFLEVVVGDVVEIAVHDDIHDGEVDCQQRSMLIEEVFSTTELLQEQHELFPPIDDNSMLDTRWVDVTR